MRTQCSDGVVLGADLQYSTDFIKTAGRKIFVIPSGPNYDAIAAASGNADAAKKCIEVMIDYLAEQETAPTLRQFKEWVEACLAKVYREHIDFAPPGQGKELACDLLIGVRIDGQTHLFRTNRTMLIEEDVYACLGMGIYMGHYSLSQVLNLATSVGLGAQLVTHVIATSKDFIEGVGKGTDVHILRDDGLHDSLVRPECLKVEEQFLRLFSMFREVVSCAELWKTDEDLNFWMNQLQGAIEGLRNSQREHNERKRLQANRITEARPNRIPARDGPLLPQPSPESHGESGES